MAAIDGRVLYQQASPIEPQRLGTPPGPRLQMKSAALPDLHRFGACRFHRSMGPAVGLIKMVENRSRHTPPTVGEAALNRQVASSPDLRSLCRKAEIDDNGLEAAALSSGFGHASHANVNRPSSGLHMSCPGNSSALKKRVQLSRMPPAEGSSSSLDLDNVRNKVKVPPLSCVVTEEASPKTLKSPEVPRSCVTGSESQEIIPGSHSMHIDEGLANAPVVAGNFPTMHGGTSPQHWRRAQKRAVTRGSEYSSRMRAISLM